jgi:hypothetical protein
MSLEKSQSECHKAQTIPMIGSETRMPTVHHTLSVERVGIHQGIMIVLRWRYCVVDNPTISYDAAMFLANQKAAMRLLYPDDHLPVARECLHINYCRVSRGRYAFLSEWIARGNEKARTTSITRGSRRHSPAIPDGIS